MRSLAAAILLVLALPGESQIFADVSTSMGNFTIQLHHQAAPLAVANFITLAQGTRPWIDSTTGAVRSNQPFYNGLTFHRVAPGFVIQTGSRKGDGSDGPGYTFPDELGTGFSHSAPHVVSMANNGLNTNGSQFFITDAAAPYLDVRHSIFGFVSSGGAVVDAINAVPTGANERPLSPVTLHEVVIRRVGSSALAFNEHAQPLPVVKPASGIMQVQRNTEAAFLFHSPPASGDRVAATASTDLVNWSPHGSTLIGVPPLSGSPPFLRIPLDNATQPRRFYHISVSSHPNPTAPDDLAGQTLALDLGNAILAFIFDAGSYGGTVVYLPDGGSPIEGFFEALEWYGSAYGLRFVADTTFEPRYFLVDVGCSSVNPGYIGARHRTRYSESGLGWFDFAAGLAEISR